jgi:hypothetical protein
MKRSDIGLLRALHRGKEHTVIVKGARLTADEAQQAALEKFKEKENRIGAFSSKIQNFSIAQKKRSKEDAHKFQWQKEAQSLASERCALEAELLAFQSALPSSSHDSAQLDDAFQAEAADTVERWKWGVDARRRIESIRHSTAAARAAAIAELRDELQTSMAALVRAQEQLAVELASCAGPSTPRSLPSRQAGADGATDALAPCITFADDADGRLEAESRALHARYLEWYMQLDKRCVRSAARLLAACRAACCKR